MLLLRLVSKLQLSFDGAVFLIHSSHLDLSIICDLLPSPFHLLSAFQVTDQSVSLLTKLLFLVIKLFKFVATLLNLFSQFSYLITQALVVLCCPLSKVTFLTVEVLLNLFDFNIQFCAKVQ